MQQQYKSLINIQDAQDDSQRQQWIRRNVNDVICLNNQNFTVNFIFSNVNKIHH